MTNKRTFAFLCFYYLLLPVVFGQNPDQLTDTAQLSARPTQNFESISADSIDRELDVPNVFTPNGDDINDYFEVTTDDITVYEFTIYTRTGTRIFHSISKRIFWDGKSIGGKELSEGIYYYVIEKVGGSDPIEESGFMHLFR